MPEVRLMSRTHYRPFHQYFAACDPHGNREYGNPKLYPMRCTHRPHEVTCLICRKKLETGATQ